MLTALVAAILRTCGSMIYAKDDRIAASVSHHAFGLASSAGGIEHIQRVGGFHGYAIHKGSIRHQLVPVHIAGL